MKKRLATEAMRNQFDSTYHMTEILVDLCPDDLWLELSDGTPFWLYVYHCVFYMDFWFRDVYSPDPFQTMQFEKAMPFDGRIRPELDAVLYDGLFVSRGEMKRYLAAIHKKTARIFDDLDDERLAAPIVEGRGQYTYTDMILGQIRHVMYNIGYLNGILRRRGLPASEWYAYNEEEGS